MLPPELKCLGDKLVDEVVHARAGTIKVFVAVKPEERSESQSVGEFRLGEVEGLAEELLFGSSRAAKNINRFAKEKFGRAVEGELEEEWLQVDSGSVAGHFGNQMLDVRLEGIEVSYLGLGKVGADKCLERVSKRSFATRLTFLHESAPKVDRQK